MNTWPFPDPKNAAVFITKPAALGDAPILEVSHDIEDGSWQFLCATTIDERNLLMVGLEEVVEIDPTVLEIADLPLGWTAWRSAVGSPWQKTAQPMS